MPKKEAAAPTTIKFTQICGGADGLYALDQEGRVFVYDDDHGWEQVELDDSRELLEEEPQD